MEVDFYNIQDKNRKTILFSIDESFFDNNFEYFESNGIEVDIYGTTVLPINKSKLLMTLIDKKINFKLFDFLNKACKENLTLVIEGN